MSIPDSVFLKIEGHGAETAMREILHLALKRTVKTTGEFPLHDFVISRARTENTSIHTETEIDFCGKCGKKEYIHKINPEKNDTQNMTDAVKMSFYYLFCELYETSLPWGAQTGIRPAQLAAKKLKTLSFEGTVKSLAAEYGISEEKATLAANVALNESRVLAEKPRRGVSLYIGIPFCPTRCLYCSFVSLPLAKQKKNIAPYVDCLVKEIEYVGEMLRSEGIITDSIYIGGGTPTSLDNENLKKLLFAVKRAVDINSLAEYTIEAGRADTITREKLESIKNFTPPDVRISINPQTLNDSVLEHIGRRHTVRQFKDAFFMARALGFDNINTDLIAGLPSETYEMFISSLNELCEMSPENITMHTMCIKRAAALDGGMVDTSDETARKMVSEGGKILCENGYEPYYMYRQKDTLGGLENTGYSKRGKEGLYNILMMEDLSTVIGLGAGGVSKLINPETNRIDRVYNYKDPWEYIANFDEIISRKRLK
ncbi:MAG: coproporphyrinogen dehydrogenase HemZ [Bacillota bacterium]|nr:coproporphyrinogen dehydrogenase HemZ [Bacillota bacterium]